MRQVVRVQVGTSQALTCTPSGLDPAKLGIEFFRPRPRFYRLSQRSLLDGWILDRQFSLGFLRDLGSPSRGVGFVVVVFSHFLVHVHQGETARVFDSHGSEGDVLDGLRWRYNWSDRQ
ncbi:hypothetical protein BJY00DRAFT_292926 [Aspergillus carlsbadensis]|nr:hypothetical protein BJY00DRAFT_292926 [Aspergillus carlsbadensis]